MFEDNSQDALIKVIDFGLACKYSKIKMMSGKVGTVTTMSPELLNGEYNHMTDMWSVGVMAYQLLSGGNLPFSGSTCDEMASEIVKGQYSLDGPEWRNVSNAAKNFVRGLLRMDPHLRMTAETALKSTWLSQYLHSTSLNTLEDPTVKKALQSLILRHYDSSMTLDTSDSSTSTADDTTSTADDTTFDTPSSKLQKLVFMVVAHHSSSSVEMRKLQQIFYAIDTDHDGRISLTDLKQGLNSLFHEHAIEAWFTSIDEGGFGKIDYTKFIAAVLEAEQIKISKDKVKKAFHSFDKNNSGYITPDQLLQVFRGTSSSDNYGENELLTELIDEIHEQYEGKISFKEFKNLFEDSQPTNRAIPAVRHTSEDILDI